MVRILDSESRERTNQCPLLLSRLVGEEYSIVTEAAAGNHTEHEASQ